MAITQKQAEWFQTSFASMVDNVELALLGKRHVIELVFAAMVSEGHVLLEDFPGTGKTALARSMSQTLKGTSSRIQFTPDLLPGDVTGISVYDQKKGVFEFHAGPIFANVVLADEINRASPKTQSALLEAMEEGKVTIDGVTRSTGVPFIVIATQNPIEQAGTYRLPEAQLDRFMIKTSIGYPDLASTLKILEGTSDVMGELSPVVSQEVLVQMSDMSRGVFVNPLVLDYIAKLVEATREAKQIKMGSSVRGARSLTKLSKTWAAAHGRTFVTPDDVKTLAEVVLAHRLVLDPEAEFDGVTANAVIGQILLDIVPPSGSDVE
ncbi:MoxR-like ATPase [Aurantimicrobium minutum]|uniref:AAA family ATPase n=1 Tax=Aurantimicrobium minutum TaxID=708131 RepID=UPI00247599F3|nr:MoxR family ATPase [Aurantimicrobium minutum]MDH6410485.1 MoxR-like ATPase [Aurantimicrobium minutum]